MASDRRSLDDYLKQIAERYSRLVAALKEAEESLRSRPSRLIEVKAGPHGSWQEAWAWQSQSGFLEGEVLLRRHSLTEPLGELAFKFVSGELGLEDMSFYIFFHSVRGKAMFEKKSEKKVVVEVPFLYAGQSLAEVSLSIEKFRH